MECGDQAVVCRARDSVNLTTTLSSSVTAPIRYGSRATLTTTSGALVSLQGLFALGDDVPEAIVTSTETNKVPSRMSARDGCHREMHHERPVLQEGDKALSWVI